MMKHVLVAYDGSVPARRALAHAAELARPGDAVTVVNVMHEPGVGARIEPPVDERNRQWCLLDEAQRLLASRGIRARTMATVGDAALQPVSSEDRAKGRCRWPDPVEKGRKIRETRRR